MREHLAELKKRNIRSATILAVFNQFFYVPKHTVGEQLLQVRDAKREQAAYESATSFDRGEMGRHLHFEALSCTPCAERRDSAQDLLRSAAHDSMGGCASHSNLRVQDQAGRVS